MRYIHHLPGFLTKKYFKNNFWFLVSFCIGRNFRIATCQKYVA
jgi:hypothetical protein